MVDELLPIGSVVKLNDTNKRLMIYGIKPQSTEDEKIYDYCAVPYPEGFIGDEYLYLFNNEDIELWLYSGYEDEERDYFINNLKKKLEPENAIDMPDKPLKEELEAAKQLEGEYWYLYNHGMFVHILWLYLTYRNTR